MKTKIKGFTLVETLIVVAILSVLVAIAVPYYGNYIMKSKRSDARISLMSIQMSQEKYRSNNPTYGSLVNIGESATSAEGKYAMSITSPTDTSYTATATPQGGQTNDTECASITITVTNGNAIYGPSDACWGK